jgi:twinkle protein
MANFALEYNVHVHIVAHSRKQKDENDVPGKMDVMGAGGITNIPDNGFTVWRNKKKEAAMNEHKIAGTMPDYQLINEHDAVLSCWKCRDNGENEKSYALWYDIPSMQYLERHGDVPRTFDEESPF